MRKPLEHYIRFEIEGRTLVVASQEVQGVGKTCPVLSIDLGQPGAIGLVQWDHRLFPIVDPFKRTYVDLKASTFLFVGGEEPFAVPVMPCPGLACVDILAIDAEDKTVKEQRSLFTRFQVASSGETFTRFLIGQYVPQKVQKKGTRDAA